MDSPDSAITRRGLLMGGLALLSGVTCTSTRCLSVLAQTAISVPSPQRLATATERRGQDPASWPQTVKAVYLSYYSIGDHTIRERVFDLLYRTALNAVVIDVKGDEGFLPYESQVPLVREVGATGSVHLRDFDDVLARLKAKTVYLIARIVVFKDNVLARRQPAWAVSDAGTGSPWLDAERLAWLDPFVQEAWAYAIAIAGEVVHKGFDEIQFDYLRFPTDGKLGAARYSQPNTRASRLQAIAAFLEQARATLAPTGARMGLDMFGYTAFNVDDTGIGQRIEELAPLVDVLCPMAYPSSYHLGIPGYRNPVAHPYEVVLETVRRTRERARPTPAQVRPWIQDFRDYAFDRRPFEVAEVRAQMKAALDAGATGWMLWNPYNRYTVEALEPKAGLEPR
jgi:hypothetical protein